MIKTRYLDEATKNLYADKNLNVRKKKDKKAILGSVSELAHA